MLLELIVSSIIATTTPHVVLSIPGVVTAYSAIESCADSRCIMASGKSAKVGDIACPRALPFGTRVRIRGKIYTCEDRTAIRFDGRFDIFMGYDQAAHNAAIVWGKRRAEVQVLSKVNDTIKPDWCSVSGAGS